MLLQHHRTQGGEAMCPHLGGEGGGNAYEVGDAHWEFLVQPLGRHMHSYRFPEQ